MRSFSHGIELLQLMTTAIVVHNYPVGKSHQGLDSIKEVPLTNTKTNVIRS
ncbi:MAG: hypothetical protein QNJ55_01890 [Xenococcus sp. MO_188.B8]|nr:hypothetical protein [Xenococcus sp. MO_188.B8]